MENETLYARLGGRDVITAAISSLFSRLLCDTKLGRFWENVGEERIYHEKEELTALFCSAAGGPFIHDGHDLLLLYEGMDISQSDWKLFEEHLDTVFELFKVNEAERDEVVALIEKVKAEILR